MEMRILIVIDKSVDPAHGHGVTSWALDLKAELQRQNVWCELAGYYPQESPFDIGGNNQAEKNEKLLKVVNSNGISAIISGTSKTAFACWPQIPSHVVKIATIHGAKPGIVKRELLAGNLVDAYLGVSEPVKIMADKFKPKKPAYFINNGISLGTGNLPTVNLTKTILWIGRLQIEQKRAHWLSHIAPLINEAGFALHIIGKGSCKSWLLKKLQGYKVEWSENLSRAQVDELMVKSAAVLFTSSYEGLSVAMLEAMKAGCLIIAPDLPNMKAGVLTQDNSLLYKANTDNRWQKQTGVGIKAQLEQLQSADQKTRRENAFTTLKEQCELKKTAEEYVKLISHIAKQNPTKQPTIIHHSSLITNSLYQRYGFLERNWQRVIDSLMSFRAL